jgi:uncharacterized protein (DUF2147 family)
MVKLFICIREKVEKKIPFVKPLVGLQIVRYLTWDGSEWEGGTIVDPENGKIYSTKMWLDESNPNKLYVRGYIGPFFRTQTWLRVVE